MFLHALLMMRKSWKILGESPKKGLSKARLDPGCLYLRTLKLFIFYQSEQTSLASMRCGRALSAFLIHEVTSITRKSWLQPPSKSRILMKELLFI